MREVLISIQPKWCELIALGKKTVEVRKTRPKIDVPFKCYIYCTKDNTDFVPSKIWWKADNTGFQHILNGKVIGEFVCDCITPLYNVCYDEWERLLGVLNGIEKELVKQACLTENELHNYASGKNCFAWHISDLVIYDKPKELGEFNHCGVNYHFNPPITRPPQSWCYVELLKGGAE